MSGEALGAAAMAQAATALVIAQQAKREACKATIAAFDSKTATVAEIRSYADCANLLYPEKLSATDTIGLKVVFVVALLGMALGAWRGWSDSYGDGLVYAIMYGLLGFVFVPLGLGAVVGLLVGIVWLFT